MFQSFTVDQILMFSEEQAEAVTAEQQAELSDEQLEALAEVGGTLEELDDDDVGDGAGKN